ncbi:hypothetical protein GGQ68_002963 [Sagittula marina]|uniref:Uncharacterized protein n=1 Tax=Sagittula marina TaxID=943940 RepID=A0A7W6DP12_9RHOB|nr:hypothetical protein [Sagittula marina]MBB3986620.1 hypothetical protein [Sagittula marina]
MADTISVDDVMNHAERAAAEVLGKPSDLGDYKIGVWREFGTVGIWIKDPNWEKFEPREMLEVSDKITKIMGPVAREAQPEVKVIRGGITMGYFPVDKEFMAHFK